MNAPDLPYEPPTKAKASTEAHPDTPELDEIRIEALPCKHCGAVDFVPLSNQAKASLTRLLAKRELEGRIAALSNVPVDHDFFSAIKTHEYVKDTLAELREELAKYE